MKVTRAEIVISAVGPAQYPQDALPEVAFVGRSNVGKSSLINCLINRKKLVRTSATPGKTQTLNFYLINKSFYFVDLPGYGYAKVPKRVKRKWGKMIEHYLMEREHMKGIVHVIDLRHPPSDDDVNMYRWLKHYAIPTVVVATKADKVPRGKRPEHANKIHAKLAARRDEMPVIFSAQTGEGKSALWRRLAPLLDEIQNGVKR